MNQPFFKGHNLSVFILKTTCGFASFVPYLLLSVVSNYICSANASNFTARLVRELLEKLKANTLFIEPGDSLENGYKESFNAKLQNQFLNREILICLKKPRF